MLSSSLLIRLQWDKGVTALDDGTCVANRVDYRRALIMHETNEGANSSCRYRLLQACITPPRFLECNTMRNCLFVMLSGDAVLYRYKAPRRPGPRGSSSTARIAIASMCSTASTSVASPTPTQSPNPMLALSSEFEATPEP